MWLFPDILQYIPSFCKNISHHYFTVYPSQLKISPDSQEIFPEINPQKTSWATCEGEPCKTLIDARAVWGGGINPGSIHRAG